MLAGPSQSPAGANFQVAGSRLDDEIQRVLPVEGSPLGDTRIHSLLAESIAFAIADYGNAMAKPFRCGKAKSGTVREVAMPRIAAPIADVDAEDPDSNMADSGPRIAVRHQSGHSNRISRKKGKSRQLPLSGNADVGHRSSGHGDAISSHLTDQIITYIGNKRSLLHFIGNGLNTIRHRLKKDRLRTFDVFSGSGVVARYMKGFSEHLSVSDIEEYSAIVNSCFLANSSEVDHELVMKWIDRMNRIATESPIRGIISDLYAPEDDKRIKLGERAFYTQRNARFIDTARAVIDDAPEGIKVHLIAPLLYVASVHANTSGVFKGFYKNSETGIGQFGGNGNDALTRICKSFTIPYPIYSEHECGYSIHLGDSNVLAATHPHVDVAYLDPPYNQHPYGSNYFMLNVIAKNQRPPNISDVSGIPTDWTRSAYNRRHQARQALTDLAMNLDAEFLLISFNSEGFIAHEEMVETLAAIGRTEVLETNYNAFRGSRNLAHRDIHVTEYLYLVEKG